MVLINNTIDEIWLSVLISQEEWVLVFHKAPCIIIIVIKH